MKLIGYVLMTAALLLGTIAATSAYTPKLDDSVIGLTLNGPAGRQLDEDGNAVVNAGGSFVPLAKKNTELTEELIETLRANGVERVLVKEFSFTRWSYWWMFTVGVALMLVGAMMVKAATRQQIQASTSSADGDSPGSPTQIVSKIEQEITSLRRDLEDVLDASGRVVTIVDRVGALLGDLVIPFYDTRTTIIGKMGLAGFAGVMDRMAALERSLNRAWSAAADEHEPEAMASLEQAALIMAEVKDRLGMPA
jgi:hypothetical protein